MHRCVCFISKCVISGIAPGDRELVLCNLESEETQFVPLFLEEGISVLNIARCNRPGQCAYVQYSTGDVSLLTLSGDDVEIVKKFTFPQKCDVMEEAGCALSLPIPVFDAPQVDGSNGGGANEFHDLIQIFG